MKRTPVVAAAIFAGAIAFQHEKEKSGCDDTPCAVEPPLTVPEQPHSSEEKPEVVAEVQFVEIPSSPAIFVKHGSKEHRDWDANNEWKARVITDAEILNWIRERAAERDS